MKEKVDHPYMKVLQDTLKTAETKKELLEKRLAMIDLEYQGRSPYQLNEAEIIKIETRSEISSISRVIREKKQYYVKFMQQYIEDIDEIESNFDTVINKAKEMAKNDEVLAERLKMVNWTGLDSNTEAKIYVYKQFKKYINQNTK